MKRFKLIGALLGALFALLLTAASALALGLPDISVTLGGGYPLHAEGSSAGTETELSTAGGIVLKGRGLALLHLTTELSALGTFTATFAAVEATANKEKCKTGTEPAGTVVALGEFHVVPLNLGGTVGALYLLTAVEVTCGALKTRVRGAVLASLNAGSEPEELSSFGVVLQGKEGRQNITEYYNDGGTKVRVNLEFNGGAEYVPAAEDVEEEIKLVVLGGQMLTITNR